MMNVTEIYRHVIQDVINSVRQDFVDEANEEVLQQLKEVWEGKLLQYSGISNGTDITGATPAIPFTPVPATPSTISSIKEHYAHLADHNTNINTPSLQTPGSVQSAFTPLHDIENNTLTPINLPNPTTPSSSYGGYTLPTNLSFPSPSQSLSFLNSPGSSLNLSPSPNSRDFGFNPSQRTSNTIGRDQLQIRNQTLPSQNTQQSQQQQQQQRLPPTSNSGLPQLNARLPSLTQQFNLQPSGSGTLPTTIGNFNLESIQANKFVLPPPKYVTLDGRPQPYAPPLPQWNEGVPINVNLRDSAGNSTQNSNPGNSSGLPPPPPLSIPSSMYNSNILNNLGNGPNSGFSPIMERAAKKAKNTSSTLNQYDGGNDSEEDDEFIDGEDDSVPRSSSLMTPKTPGLASNEETLDSDLDDEDDEEPDTDNLVLCQFEKIARNKNKRKCNLKDGIMHLNGRDYVFSKAVGECEF